MYINGIDYVDNKIVKLLKNNARMSYSDIASEIGLSRTAVTTRITNLEKAGIIKGYKTIVKTELLSFLMNIETKPETFEDWKQALKNIPEVNDKYGRTIGNTLILKVCNAIKEIVSKEAVLIRYSGLRFLVITPGSNSQISQPIMEKVLQTIKKISEYVEDEEIAKKIKAIITAIRQKFPREGISSFYYKVEE